MNKTAKLLLFGLWALSCTPQHQEPVLARVGTKIITQSEFRQRAEFSPEQRYQGVRSGRAAYLLDLLIDEKLTASAAETAGLDTSSSIRHLSQFIEDLALARELYRREIQEPTLLDEKEINRAVQYAAQTRIVGYLVFHEERQARRIQQQLATGYDFNKALRAIYGPGADTTLNLREFKWGENDEVLENTVFNLLVGEVAPVIPAEGAYLVMVLRNIRNNLIVTESEIAQRRRFCERTLRLRKEAARSDQFMAALFKEKKIQFNKPLLQTLIDYISAKSVSVTDEKPAIQERPLPLKILDDATNQLQSDLETPLVMYTKGSLTLRQILGKWRYYNPTVEQGDLNRQRRSIARAISLMVRDVLLAEEGSRRGYGKCDRVSEDVRIWQDYYLCTALLQQMQSNANFYLQPWLKKWRNTYTVHVDSVLLQKTELTDIPVLALRIGQYHAMVAPPWTHFPQAP